MEAQSTPKNFTGETTEIPSTESNSQKKLDLPAEIKEEVEEIEKQGGLGPKLRNIERDGVISYEASNRAAQALLLGSAAYISTVHESIPEKIQESLPEELKNISKEDLPEELKDYDFGDLEDPGGYLPEEITHFGHEIMENKPEITGELEIDQELKDEVIHQLNKDTESFGELEGIEPAETPRGVIEQWPAFIENAPEIILTGFDEIAHFGIGAYMATTAAKATDSLTGEEYEPKKVALGGMMMVPTYALIKEGWYEGGNDISFQLEKADVMGDWLMDTLGATYGVWRYHKNKTKNNETTPGRMGQLAREIGRTYAKAENLLKLKYDAENQKESSYEQEISEMLENQEAEPQVSLSEAQEALGDYPETQLSRNGQTIQRTKNSPTQPGINYSRPETPQTPGKEQQGQKEKV